MSMFSQRRVAAPQPSRSMSSSDNSHTSESTASQQGSKYSLNTSSGTHFPSVPPLPRGAEPPQVNLPATEHNFGFNPHAKRKARVLRKPHPPPSICNPSARNGNLFYMANSGPPPRSGRVAINLNDTVSFPDISHRRSLFTDSVLPPSPFYEVSRHSRSRDESYESRAIDGRIPAAEHAAHTFGTLTRSTDAFERPRMKVAHVEENEDSHAITQMDSHSRTSIMMKPPLVHRDKPLPSLPGPSHSYNGLASSKPTEPLPSHRLLPDVYPFYPSLSREGQAKPPFNHFVAGPNGNPGHGIRRYAQTDVGHTQSWFDSGHSAIRCASDTHCGASEPQSRHNADLCSRNHSPPFPITSRPASCFPEFATPSIPPQRPSHLAAWYPSEPPISHAQVPHGLTRRLSWGKRLMRSLSVTLFRKNTVADNSIQELPYLDSDPGHSSTFHQPASVAHSLVAMTQHKPQDNRPHHSSRKLRKRDPSHSHSRSSTPGAILTSRSSPALYHHIYKSRERVQELCDVLSQDVHSEFDTSPNPSPNKKRSISTPMRCSTGNITMTRHSGPSTSTPTLTAQWIQSQPISPTSSGARKLVKRHARRKVATVDGHLSLTLAPLRTHSLFNSDLIPQGFSDASRCRSAPILGPTDSASGCFPSSPYVAFPTDSPPSEPPHAREFPVGERSWSEHNHSMPQSQDFPSLLHSGFSRRWTLAVFDAPEEQMVEELDRLRNVGWGPGFQGELVRVKNKPVMNNDADDQEQGPVASSEKEELEEWLVARKALMICREIVRTEKSYREGLIKLQRGETLKPPPPLLLQYLPALISASLAFSARLDDDPSTSGVSVAFLGTEDALEVALVAWSGIVGEFFGAPTGNQRKRRTADYKILEKEKKGKDKNKKYKSKMTGVPVLPSATYSDLGHAHDRSTRAEMKYVPGNRRTSLPALSDSLTSSADTTPAQQRSWYFPASTVPTAAKLSMVQDLAIQPTQRVMRYVLLYKDLLSSTPTVSPARGLVEQALEGATRIAQRCNRAQDNAAFLT